MNSILKRSFLCIELKTYNSMWFKKMYSIIQDLNEVLKIHFFRIIWHSKLRHLEQEQQLLNFLWKQDE